MRSLDVPTARVSKKQLAALERGRRKLAKIRRLSKELCRLTGKPISVACKPPKKAPPAPPKRSARGRGSSSRAATTLPRVPPPPPPASAPAAEEQILSALRELVDQRGRGSLIPVARVRARVKQLTKGEFDRAANNLSNADRIIMHHHDSPMALPENERAELVVDPYGTYYVGMALRG